MNTHVHSVIPWVTKISGEPKFYWPPFSASLTHYNKELSCDCWLKGIFRISHIFSGKGNGNPLQYSCLENPMDGRAWKAAVHGVAEVGHDQATSLSLFTFHALEKEMATHSSVFAWRIPGTGEPGGLLSMGSHRVGHDWRDLAAAAAAYF